MRTPGEAAATQAGADRRRGFVDRVATFEKAHDIKVAAGPPLTIQGDADQLEQLLINLIRNAVDAVTETGGGGPGRLAARARLLTTDGGALGR